ncbi:hypothetical protein SDC9_181271 [bioreactor metagenome]|uniref:Uncharacterized protein n=1 Tax=bioreactor metagenome TaxID=1076179 RepID=A0A645H6R8_9ZZZZ
MLRSASQCLCQCTIILPAQRDGGKGGAGVAHRRVDRLEARFKRGVSGLTLLGQLFDDLKGFPCVHQPRDGIDIGDVGLAGVFIFHLKHAVGG